MEVARPLQLIKDVNDRKELWKIAVKVKDKWKNVRDGKESFEMVVVDSKGDSIFVVVPPDLNNKFNNVIKVNNTYCFQNFQVLKNDEKYKLADHQYKLKLNGATRVYDENVHKIPDSIPKFKDFAEIAQGKWREDLLYDTIGFTQPHKGRKIQVNFDLKDLKDNKIHCTLWEDYAAQFFNCTTANSDTGGTIICIKYAKIKAEGKYPLTVSNTWNTTKLYINDNIPEIIDFKNSLNVAISNGTLAAISDTPSQMMSQSSGGSQYTPEQKFSIHFLNRNSKLDRFSVAQFFNELGNQWLLIDTNGVQHNVEFNMSATKPLITNGWSSLRTYYKWVGNKQIAFFYCGNNNFLMKPNKGYIPFEFFPSFHSLSTMTQINLSFLVIIDESSFNSTELVLPPDFSKFLLEKNHSNVKLCGPLNHVIDCKVIVPNSTSLPVQFGEGWTTFCQLNGIAEGNRLIFECESEMDYNNVLIVSPFSY